MQVSEDPSGRVSLLDVLDVIELTFQEHSKLLQREVSELFMAADNDMSGMVRSCKLHFVVHFGDRVSPTTSDSVALAVVAAPFSVSSRVSFGRLTGLSLCV